MKKSLPMLAYAIIFLVFIQAAGTLVESIYILDLMHTTLDAKVLGLLFFLAPLLLVPFARKSPRPLAWLTFAVLLAARGMLPFLDTNNRLVAAGLATGASFGLFLLMLITQLRRETGAPTGQLGAAGLAMAVSLSVLLRTVNHGVEYSLTPTGGWTGILLGLILGGALMQMDWESQPHENDRKTGTTPALLGIFLILTLVWFAFSAPAVLARWSEGNYALIVGLTSLLSAAASVWILLRSQVIQSIPRPLLLTWNLAFTASLIGTILVHGVAFPVTPDAPAVTVGAPLWWQAIPLVLTLLLFPVLFLDLGLFLGRIGYAAPTPRQLVPGVLLGSLALILLVFVHIFSNVWGYVEPVSLFFRGKFWLAYFLPAAGVCLLVWAGKKVSMDPKPASGGNFHWAWGLLAALICLGTLVGLLPVRRVQVEAAGKTSLLVMTYNIQEANDKAGEKSLDRQLALIRQVSPDILSLQETDSTRISLNNNDYVRYYADKLGYYSYYGPTTVTGTYGTAILSKFPLQNTRSVFTYSDTDEIGVAEAQVEVGGRRFFIYDVHPDGSDTAMLVFARALLQRSQGQANVIALGDFNLRDYEEAYQLIEAIYKNAWTSVYPSKISADGVDMSGKNRIDHIFVSQSLEVRNPVYLLPPDSVTDHPVHWAEITWEYP